MFAQKVISKEFMIHVWMHNLPFASHVMTRIALTWKIDNSIRAAVILQVESSYTAFNFLVVCVSTHEMCYRKDTMTRFGAITPQPYLACSSNKKERNSLIVEQSFSVQTACIYSIVFELCMSKRKKKATAQQSKHKCLSIQFQVNYWIKDEDILMDKVTGQQRISLRQ